MMSNQQPHNTESPKPNHGEDRSAQRMPEPYRQPFDWTRFWIRFGCGAALGTLFGFGFWIQMCRPARTLGPMEHVPRLVTGWLGLGDRVESGLTGMLVIVVFACVSGMIVAAWPSISKRFTGS